MKAQNAITILLALALTACTETAPETGATPSNTTTSKDASENQAQNNMANTGKEIATKQEDFLPDDFRKGMPYSDFRKIALKSGWNPLRDAACKANVVGSNHAQLCAENADLEICRICDEMTELSSCSSDGYCLAKFSRDGTTATIEVVGYGEINHWNKEGDGSGFTLDSWQLIKTE